MFDFSFPQFRKLTIQSLQTQSVLEALPITELRKNTRIAVIDDEPFQPLESLLFEGYQISYIGNYCNTIACDPYHILLCDIQSVGVDLEPKDQGAAVVGEIKRVFPEKYIIVYSGLDKRSGILRKALDRSDAHIPKSSSLELYHAVLDDAIRWTLDPIQIWDRTKRRLMEAKVSTQEVAEIEHRFVRSVLNRSPEPLRSLFKKPSGNQLTKDVAKGLLTSALWSVLSGGVG
jgi:hypothetical protein